MKQLTPRKFERRRFLGTATVRSLKDGGSFRAEMLNLGQGGVGLFAGRFLEVGAQVQVTLPVVDKEVPAEVRTREGRVASTKVLPDGNIMGISFGRPLTDAELKTLTENVHAPR